MTDVAITFKVGSKYVLRFLDTDAESKHVEENLLAKYGDLWSLARIEVGGEKKMTYIFSPNVAFLGSAEERFKALNFKFSTHTPWRHFTDLQPAHPNPKRYEEGEGEGEGEGEKDEGR